MYHVRERETTNKLLTMTSYVFTVAIYIWLKWLIVTRDPRLSGAERIALLQPHRGTRAPVPLASEHKHVSVVPREGGVRIRGQAGDELGQRFGLEQEFVTWAQFIPEPVIWSLQNRQTIPGYAFRYNDSELKVLFALLHFVTFMKTSTRRLLR